MPERCLSGASASPGIALGPARRWEDEGAGSPAGSRAPTSTETSPPRAGDVDAELAAATAALAGAAAELEALAASLARDEAEILRTGVLMAGDPALAAAVRAAIETDALPADAAVLRATDAMADTIAALDDELLAARADDVRSLGRRAARRLRGGAQTLPAGAILVATELGPADVAELAAVAAGVALAGGGATAHAAIVARSLGLPMVTGLGGSLLDVADGAELLLDGDTGTLTLDPARGRARAARQAVAARSAATARARAERELPAVTTDGRRVSVLANVAGPGELAIGLDAGADGVGLLRTELAFLQARDWPTENQHLEAIEAALAGLGSLPAVVRVLDFGGDKCPPFLRSSSARGVSLLLRRPDAFVRQLRAILLLARDRDLRIMLPLVQRPAQLIAARELIERTAREIGVRRLPPVGAMVETPGAASAARALAARSDFLSVGTNDLTSSTLGADRFAANSARPYHPRVLALIRRTVTAGHEAGIKVEVCGEAASDPVALPLLVGLGVDELSVGAARVGTVRRWIRHLDFADAGALADRALEQSEAGAVAALVAPLARELALLEGGDAGDESVQGGSRVLAVGT